MEFRPENSSPIPSLESSRGAFFWENRNFGNISHFPSILGTAAASVSPAEKREWRFPFLPPSSPKTHPWSAPRLPNSQKFLQRLQISSLWIRTFKFWRENETKQQNKGKKPKKYGNGIFLPKKSRSKAMEKRGKSRFSRVFPEAAAGKNPKISLQSQRNSTPNDPKISSQSQRN